MTDQDFKILQRQLYHYPRLLLFFVVSIWKDQITPQQVIEQSDDNGGLHALSNSILTVYHRGVHIDESHSNIGDMRGIIHIAWCVADNPSVQHLDLSYTYMTYIGATYLATAFETNNSLSFVSLRGNILGDTGLDAISRSLRLNNSITQLDLRSTQLTDKNAITLIECLHHNTTIRQIRIVDNNISRNCFIKIGKLLMWNYHGCLTLNKIRNMPQDCKDHFVFIMMILNRYIYCTDLNWYIMYFIGAGDIDDDLPHHLEMYIVH